MKTKYHRKELDVVKLLVDVPEHGLREGQQGTILMISEGLPKPYVVEFSDEEGVEIATVALAPDQLEVTWLFDEHKSKQIQPPEQPSQQPAAKTYFEEGMLYLNNGMLDEAKEKFRQAFEIEPDLAGNLLNAAKPFAEQEEWDLAVFICRLVLSLQPERQIARDNLAASYVNIGVEQARNQQYNEAVKYFDRALAVNPSQGILQQIQHNFMVLYTTIAVSEVTQDLFEEACDHFRLALQIAPTAETRKNWVFFQTSWGVFEEITQSGRPHSLPQDYPAIAAETGIEISELYNTRGLTLVKYRKLDEAIHAFKEAIRLNPQNNHAYENLMLVERCIKEDTKGVVGEMPLPFEIQNEPIRPTLQCA